MRPAMPRAWATLAAQEWFMIWKKRVDFIRSRLRSVKKSAKKASVVAMLPTVEPTTSPSRPP